MVQGPRHLVNFNPNPVQKNFIESKAKADLFSSRMGEGKSTALAWSTLLHTRHNPGASWALIRDTFENITGTTQKTFFSWFPPGVFGTYNASRKTFTWASGIAQGEVIFMGMDDQQDASKLMSRELAGFGIDEPAPAVGSAGVDEMIFDMAMSRLRQPEMKWYGAKLAENNPDEAHWTYRRFVNPGSGAFKLWQPAIPENVLHLPPSYYAELRVLFAHRPDLVRRFVEGEFGFQQVGRSCAPQWNDKLHLTLGLTPLPRLDVFCLWDFGHNPTCIFTQVTPLGHWNILDAMVGEDIGVEELIENWVRPVYNDRYKPLKGILRHIGDPAGATREQTSYSRSAVRAIRTSMGGTWRAGPVRLRERLDPLQSVLTRTVKGRGLVQVDKERAGAVWHALRGGYHFHVTRTGITSADPVKNIHSHPGDAMGYGAAILFPVGRMQKKTSTLVTDQPGVYFPRRPFGPPPTAVPVSGESSVPRKRVHGWTPPKHGAPLQPGA